MGVQIGSDVISVPIWVEALSEKYKNSLDEFDEMDWKQVLEALKPWAIRGDRLTRSLRSPTWSNGEQPSPVVDFDRMNPEVAIAVASTPKKALRELRNEHVIKWYGQGMTVRTITNMVNSHAIKKGWDEVSENQCHKIILDYFKKRRELLRGVDWKENEKAFQDAMLDQQEKFLEKIVLTYNRLEKEAKFKNLFEQIQMADLISRMRQQLIENKNWNESRKNPLVVAESNTFEVNLFESSGEKMIVNGQSDAMKGVLAQLRAKFDTSNSVDADYEEVD